MTHPTPAAKAPSSKNGSIATLGAFLRAPGTGGPSHGVAVRRAALGCALAALGLLLFASPAAADTRIGQGTLGEGRGLAVSKAEDGDIYVVDKQNQRVDQFDPSKPPSEQFLRAFGWGVLDGAPELQACTTATGCQTGSFGSGPGQLNYSEEIAVDNDPASASYGDVYLVDQRNYRVEKFSPDGEFLLMFGGEVDKTSGADVCTAADLAGGDTCGAGVPGTGPSHFYKETPGTGFNGSAVNDWGGERRSGSNSIAVGPSGTVYVGDGGRIQEFEPNGTFSGQLTLPEPEPMLVTALAVDAAGDIYERSLSYEISNGSFVVHSVPGVREYDPSHNLLRTFDAEPGSEPIHISLDSSGDLFLSEFKESAAGPPSGSEFHFHAGIRVFRPSGVLYAEFGSDQVENTEIFSGGIYSRGGNNPLGIAIGDAAGQLYATVASSRPGDGFTELIRYIAAVPLPVPGPPAVTEEHLTDIEPTTATLRAVVNPREFKTEYRFQYITQKKFEEDGNSFGAGTESSPSVPVDLGSVYHEYPVSTAISPLTPGTRYRYRVLAESECEPVEHPGHVCITAPEETFETLPPVSVRDFTTQTVGPELLTLKAELNNNNSLQAGHYTIHYGTQAGNYTLGSSEGALPAGSHEFEPVKATFTGLQPNTPYHYQLTAENEYGKIETADRTVTTEPSAAEERAAEDCPANGTVHGAPSSTLREENNSLALPDCRAYEQVSPAFKGGYNVTPNGLWLAPSGERALFLSIGDLGGAVQNTPPVATQYLAHRTPAGWLTQPVLANPAGPGYVPQYSFDFSPELDRWVFQEVPALSSERSKGKVPSGALYLGHADGTYNKATPTISPVEGELDVKRFMLVGSESDDLSRLFIETTARDLAGDQRPTDSGTAGITSTRIYEVSGADGPAPAIGLLAEVPLGLPAGEQSGGCSLNAYEGLQGRRTSADGSTIAYELPIEKVPGVGCGFSGPNPIGLFAHTGAGVEIQLNTSHTPQCSPPSPCATAANAPPLLQSVSPDGSRVWFTTTQPLVDSDKDSTDDLYLAKLENGQLDELVQASQGESEPGTADGNGAGLQGIAGVSVDSSHVAFLATGVLTTRPNSSGESAAPGADNLYLYDASSGQTAFVARLCSNPERSGSLADSQCPATSSGPGGALDRPLWDSAVPNGTRLTPDGAFLIFTSFARLASDDTDNTRDLYRYDFQTAQLTRLSFGRDGNDGNGNDDVYEVELPLFGGGGTLHSPHEIAEDAGRAISADGSTVIFRTAAPLVSRDTNAGAHPGCGFTSGGTSFNHTTGCDLYQWQEQGHGTCHEAGGCIRLVSDGLDPNGISGGNISLSGRDITFDTARGLVPADTDGLGDVYDARENGGFHYTPPPTPCGGNEICHHEPPPPPSAPKITTEGDTGGNGTTPLKCGKGRHRVKKHGEFRCVPNRHHKTKKHHKRAGHNGGGGR